MSVDDVLICTRVDYLTEQIYQQLNLKTSWYPYFDDFTSKKHFFADLQLTDNTNIIILEEYDIIEYKLKISHYCYTYCVSTGKEIFRADNSEHHDVSTNPHHIHDFRFRKRGQVKAFYKQDLDNPDITEFFAHIHGERR